MGKQWEQWQTFLGGRRGSKVTADGDYSHNVKRTYSLEGKL